MFIQQMDQRKGYSQGMMTVLLKLKTQVMEQIGRPNTPKIKMQEMQGNGVLGIIG